MLKIKLPDLEKSQLHELGVIIAFMVVIVFGSFFLIFKPQIRSIRNYRAKSEVLEKDILAAREKIVRKPQLLSQIQDIKDTLVQYEKKLPREKDVPVLLKELTEIIESGEIEFISIYPQPTGPIEELAGVSSQGEYIRLPIQIKMKCGFHDLEKFLYLLERTKRFIKVADISIKGGPGEGNGHEIDLTIEVYMYQEFI